MSEISMGLLFFIIISTHWVSSLRILNLRKRVEMLEIRLNNNTWQNGKVVVMKNGGGEPGNGGGSVYPEGGTDERI